MKVLPHGAIVLGSKGSPTAFSEALEQVKANNFSGYLEVRMRIPGSELWGVIVFDEGRLVESYASRMGTDIFGEAAYIYLIDLARESATTLTLHELDSDNLLDFIMIGRGTTIKIEDNSWRPDPETIPGVDGLAPPAGETPEPLMPEGEGVIKKVVLLGDPSVGKTSIMRRFIEDTFNEAYLSTIGSNVNKKTVSLFEDDGQRTDVKMMIWDIAGDKACDSLKSAYYRGAHAGIVVFDITMDDTFNNVSGWIDKLHEIVGEIPIVILGNKADLDEFRRVDRDQLQDLADRYSAGSYQTSARTGENVEMVFHTIAKKLVG